MKILQAWRSFHDRLASVLFPRGALLLLSLATALAAAAPEYVGSAACRTCHPANYASQSKTGHAHALVKAPPGSRGQWAFGAGEKATTWVSQIDRDIYAEHGISYFAATKSTGLTPGHADSGDARYRTFDPEATTLKCFRCHSTGPLTLGSAGSIVPNEPGIHCESCHGPGSEHVSSGGRTGTILNPKRLSATEINQLCGACHRNAPESDWTDKWRTRHQPSYLSQSACFRKSGTLSCLTCHDPHTPINQVADQYEKRCIECHKTAAHRTPMAARTCVECHMPQVVVSPQLSFTNHWIGIYAKGSYLVPARSTAVNLPQRVPDHGDLVPPADPSSLRPLFEQVLAEKEKEAGPNHASVARSASDLGRFIYSKSNGNPAEAEEPLRRALAIDEANAAPEAPADRQVLAEVLSSLGRNEEAFALLQIAAKGADAKVASQSFASLALLDPAHAEEYYRGALDAQARATEKDPKHTAILLNDLALALEEKRDYAGAEPLFRKALAIQQKEIGADSPAAAGTLSNLGSLLETTGRHTEAERMERDAVRIFEQKLGPWSAELATSCANLADILATKGDLAPATSLYQRAVAIDESVYGPDNPEVAGDLVNLGTVLKQAGKQAAGDAALRRALSLYEKAFGPGSPQAVQVRKFLQ
ncbi:MAG TPA: tetratricopeptide repeat protein [Bryobacteraceae bacterium]|jgi:tetratricopeptide (TPR) repeat protein